MLEDMRKEPRSSKMSLLLFSKARRFQRSGDYGALRYASRLMSGWSFGCADYKSFSEANVCQYGPGQSPAT